MKRTRWIALVLDGRFALAVADADAVIPFIADCIAVGMGYACHPSADEEPARRTPFRRSQTVELAYGGAGHASELG